MSVKITSLPSFPSTKKWQVQAPASLRTWIVLKGHSFCSATATLAPWFSVSGGWLLGPWKGKKRWCGNHHGCWLWKKKQRCYVVALIWFGRFLQMVGGFWLFGQSRIRILDHSDGSVFFVWTVQAGFAAGGFSFCWCFLLRMPHRVCTMKLVELSNSSWNRAFQISCTPLQEMRPEVTLLNYI